MSAKNGNSPAILWFRRDLRLADNPAVSAAIGQGAPIIPVFIDDDGVGGTRPLGGASKWWRGESLHKLHLSLRQNGSQLIVRQGTAQDVLPALLRETQAGSVFFNLRR